jgi:hypothetical protein
MPRRPCFALLISSSPVCSVALGKGTTGAAIVPMRVQATTVVLHGGEDPDDPLSFVTLLPGDKVLRNVGKSEVCALEAPPGVLHDSGGTAWRCGTRFCSSTMAPAERRRRSAAL